MVTPSGREDQDEIQHNTAFRHCPSSEDQAEMQHNAAFHQSLHCLL